MQTIIWAFGSMVVFLLVLLIIRLGLTFKGKLMIAFASFVLSLGGAAAASNFSIGVTALMMGALCFFVAYFMNHRLSALMYKDTLIIDDYLKEDEEKTEAIFLQTNDLMIADAALIHNGPKEDTFNMPVIKKATDDEPILDGEDISFLQERNSLLMNNHSKVKDLENGYFSDIESLLESESGRDFNLVRD